LAGAENGISDIFAPFDALLGVFLGPNAPNLFSSPPPLYFSTLASRDYLSITPLLQQVFFIGDGRTSTGALQLVVVPEGATRLFLCTMDAFGWANNQGYFSVAVTLTNAPDATLLQIDTYPGIIVWGPIGSTQQVEFATSLLQTTWTPLTNIVLSQSPYFVVDPTPARNSSRFYRAITAP